MSTEGAPAFLPLRTRSERTSRQPGSLERERKSCACARHLQRIGPELASPLPPEPRNTSLPPAALDWRGAARRSPVKRCWGRGSLPAPPPCPPFPVRPASPSPPARSPKPSPAAVRLRAHSRRALVLHP
ncbi:submaxillary gland androgen-regulated protein 3A-like [Octodon degus]|uniref:Submaxillary gland androgen-regulated protein 3A-like n=1 Tax=Octodon degus TaxID=10160 RepID=A0A6P6DHS9_OCTDE|nr:submaxillary gland androgen-regulated protein 3A-like [Octodon degus]